jgi:hypothetical protein
MEQRERYMIGEIEERHFGPEGQIVLIEYPEAVYLKDDRDDIRILFTGYKDKQKAYEEVKRLADHYEHKAPRKMLFTERREPDGSVKPSDRKSR